MRSAVITVASSLSDSALAASSLRRRGRAVWNGERQRGEAAGGACRIVFGRGVELGGSFGRALSLRSDAARFGYLFRRGWLPRRGFRFPEGSADHFAGRVFAPAPVGEERSQLIRDALKPRSATETREPKREKVGEAVSRDVGGDDFVKRAELRG